MQPEKYTPDGPFDLTNEAGYAAWRNRKLEDYPTSIEDLIVEVRDPRNLTPAELEALNACCRKTNMAIYAGPTGSDPDKDIPGLIGAQFGLTQLDYNMGADDDGVGIQRIDVDGLGLRWLARHDGRGFAGLGRCRRNRHGFGVGW